MCLFIYLSIHTCTHVCTCPFLHIHTYQEQRLCAVFFRKIHIEKCVDADLGPCCPRTAPTASMTLLAADTQSRSPCGDFFPGLGFADKSDLWHDMPSQPDPQRGLRVFSRMLA